jgi:hypothetical protein
MQNRFNLDIARKSFFCYDCSRTTEVGGQFSWDSLRKTRICLPCLDKLKDMVGTSDDSVSDGTTTKKKVYWDKTMLPTRPWTIGNYEINSWPPHTQKEYVHYSSSQAAYNKGLKAARNRFSFSSDDCQECKEEEAAKTAWEPKDGTLEDWAALIAAQTDAEECKKVWGTVCQIKWTPDETMKIGKVYVKHLADLVSIDTWGKPLSAKNTQILDRMFK